VTGERLIEVFAALAAQAVATDTSVPAAELDALPLRTVASAATGKRDVAEHAPVPCHTCGAAFRRPAAAGLPQ